MVDLKSVENFMSKIKDLRKQLIANERLRRTAKTDEERAIYAKKVLIISKELKRLKNDKKT